MSIPYLPTPASPYLRFLKNDFVIAALIAVAMSGLTFALGFALGWFPDGVNGFEVVGATINYGATYLSIKQRRFAYALGFAASAAFAVAYFQYGLLASSILSLYLVGQLVYGYFRWGPDGSTRPVHKFQWKWAWAYVLATAVTYAGAYALSTAFGGQFAFWDAAILVLTILAQFLLDNKVLSAWFVWTAVNIVGVVLYASAGAPFAAVQQFIFGLANIWGYLAWHKTMNAEKPVYAHNTDFDPALVIAPYAAADVAATQALYDAMPGTERIIKGDDGIKRLQMSEEITARNGTNFQFTPSDTYILAIGEQPKVSDSPLWRRVEPITAEHPIILDADGNMYVIEKETIGVYRNGKQVGIYNRETGEAL